VRSVRLPSYGDGARTSGPFVAAVAGRQRVGRVARSVRVRALLFGEASKPPRGFYPAARRAPTRSRPDTTAFRSVVGDQPKSVPARHRAHYLCPHSTRQRIGTSPRRSQRLRDE
jgi:hypothetical protein